MADKHIIEENELRFADSLKIKDIPAELRCRTCQRLAFNSRRLSCCMGTICNDCYGLLDLAHCVLCNHRPYNKDACFPNNQLQSAINAFLSGEPKRHSLELELSASLRGVSANWSAISGVQTNDITIITTMMSALSISAPSAKAASMKSDADPSPSLPPRASLMGLPVELRLQIYGFLFLNVDRASDDDGHCCAQKLYHMHGILTARPLCHFRSLSDTAILRASSVISDEAMPDFYNAVQVRLVMPTSSHVKLWNPLFQLSTLPRYGLKHIRKLLLVGSPSFVMELRCGHHAIFWNCLEAALPDIRDILLHFGTTKVRPSSFSEALNGMMQLPRLERFMMEGCWGCSGSAGNNQMKVNDQARSKAFRRVLLAQIDSQCKALKKKVETIDIIAEIAHKSRKALSSTTPNLATKVRPFIGLPSGIRSKSCLLRIVGDHTRKVASSRDSDVKENQLWAFIATFWRLPPDQLKQRYYKEVALNSGNLPKRRNEEYSADGLVDMGQQQVQTSPSKRARLHLVQDQQLRGNGV